MRSKFILLHLLILLITGFLNIIFLTTTKNGITENDLRIQSIISVFISILLLLLLIKYIKKIFSAPIVFMIVMFIFHLGQVFLFSLSIDYNSILIISNNIYISKALWYTIYFFILFQMGLILTYSNRRNLTKKDVLMNSSIIKASKLVGWSMFFLFSPLYFYQLITKFYNSMVFGYISNFTKENTTTFLDKFAAMSQPFTISSIFILLSIYKNRRISSSFLELLTISMVFLNFFAGSRGAALIILLSYIYFRSENISLIKNRNLFKVGILFLLIILLIPNIASFRNVPNKSFSSYIELLTNISFNNNPIIQTLGELGGTLNVLVEVTRLTDFSVNFLLGESYFAALTSFIPSFFMFGYERVSLAEWLQDILGLNYGPGFSIIAESYYNFGVFGLFISIILGVFFGKLFSLNVKNLNYNILLGSFLASTLYFSLYIIRDQLLLFVRYELFAVILPLFFIFVIENFLKKSIKMKVDYDYKN